mmetsp:Transcript_139238/g.256119  ORF Transcript_139238/g.256119 Transcript_139238/m.256119 type:complete len:81 (-) Transcript_139238:1565-1807(-)
MGRQTLDKAIGRVLKGGDNVAGLIGDTVPPMVALCIMPAGACKEPTETGMGIVAPGMGVAPVMGVDPVASVIVPPLTEGE